LDTLSIRGELATGISTSTKLQPQAVDCVTDVVLAVAGNQGLQQIVDLANNGDTAGLSQFSLALGVRARSPIHAKCPSVTQ
jgi:hypothetical protein